MSETTLEAALAAIHTGHRVEVMTQPSEPMVKAGADRIRDERKLFAENGWGEPSDEHLAANAYEAMVFSTIDPAVCHCGGSFVITRNESVTPPWTQSHCNSCGTIEWRRTDPW